MIVKFINLLLLLICLLQMKVYSQNKNEIKYNVRLDARVNDQLTVIVEVPALKSDELIFCFPKMVPGIYDHLNYGKNISGLEAKDSKGKSLRVERIDINEWKISNAVDLKTLTYKVGDDWDSFYVNSGAHYRSSASMFSGDTLFVLNQHTLMGYFRGYSKMDCRVRYTMNPSLYGTCSLPTFKMNDTVADVRARNYMELSDNPILFCKPDTSSMMIEGVKVMVSIYNALGSTLANSLRDSLLPVLLAQQKYLNGNLSLKKYSFIIYKTENDSSSLIADGLEHRQSTFILMNSPKDFDFVSILKHVAGHEFFHIIYPLSIHSDEIQNFDFANPQLSRHLWLYEGMTEYFSIHCPVKEKLETIADFLNVLETKIKSMGSFDHTLSLTDLSTNVHALQKDYMNVYARGALVCLCLDLHFIKISRGKFSVMDLTKALLKKYKGSSFKDDELVKVIQEISHDPTFTDFYTRFISGNKPLPLKELLGDFGMNLLPDGSIQPNPEINSEQIRLRDFWLE